MKQYFCNPINVNYRYQFNKPMQEGAPLQICREAADPSMILFKDTYYIFASMNLSVWVSKDLVNWEVHRLPENLPLYDYAPDVRVMGEYVYFCASRRGAGQICSYYRTKDPVNGPYEEIPGTFDFWDPNLFADDDGRVYFYWGCTNTDPIWGVELDPKTMRPLTEKKALLAGDPFVKGYERAGEDGTILPVSGPELDQRVVDFLNRIGQPVPNTEALSALPAERLEMFRGFASGAPYIEGAWMTKHNGKYYLQYAFGGAEYNIYGDGVYVGDSPLGDFVLAENNPYSYKAGGFLPGAGHGSTMEDRYGNWWHTATMRISVNHSFERRVGIWPAAFDADGELYCNQRYGDWPLAVTDGKLDPDAAPEWYLLSRGKKVTASGAEEGKGPEKAVDENVQTWWRPDVPCEKKPWLLLDLGAAYDVRAVQINFADDGLDLPAPGEMCPGIQARFIDGTDYRTRYLLEGSADGVSYEVLEDKSEAETDLPHDFIVLNGAAGRRLRYVRLTVLEVPYDQKPCISGLRVFGIGEEEKPAAPAFAALRTNDIDMEVTVKPKAGGGRALGYVVLWGSAPEKLYHSRMVFADPENPAAELRQRIGALVKGREYCVRVDAFNEGGITEGTAEKLRGPLSETWAQDALGDLDDFIESQGIYIRQ